MSSHNAKGSGGETVRCPALLMERDGRARASGPAPSRTNLMYGVSAGTFSGYKQRQTRTREHMVPARTDRLDFL